jgi:hypothetical protein
LGLGFDTFFPARSHSPREAGRRFIRLASTFLKRGILPIPLRTNRICRYAYCLWSFFQKIGRRRRLLHLRHNEPANCARIPLKLACIGRCILRGAIAASGTKRTIGRIYAITSPARGHRRQPAKSPPLKIPLTRRRRCLKTSGPSYHRDR